MMCYLDKTETIYSERAVYSTVHTYYIILHTVDVKHFRSGKNNVREKKHELLGQFLKNLQLYIINIYVLWLGRDNGTVKLLTGTNLNKTVQ